MRAVPVEDTIHVLCVILQPSFSAIDKKQVCPIEARRATNSPFRLPCSHTHSSTMAEKPRCFCYVTLCGSPVPHRQVHLPYDTLWFPSTTPIKCSPSCRPDIPQGLRTETH